MSATLEHFEPSANGAGKIGTDSRRWGEGHFSVLRVNGGAVAPIASPTFTGVPAGPTAAPGTNTTQLATTAFVKAASDLDRARANHTGFQLAATISDFAAAVAATTAGTKAHDQNADTKLANGTSNEVTAAALRAHLDATAIHATLDDNDEGPDILWSSEKVAAELASITVGEVNTSLIASGAVTTAKLADGSVTTAKVADANITTAKLASEAVTGEKVAGGTLAPGNSKYWGTSSLGVFGFHALPTVSLGDLGTLDQVDTAEIVDAAVTAAKLDSSAVTTDKLASAAVTAAKLASDAVTTAKILDANVTTAKVADLAITAAKVASNAVTTAKILDANVTAAKLASDAVTTAKILDANVTTAKVADLAITTAKVAGGSSLPGNYKYWGTNATGTVGFHDVPLTTVAVVQLSHTLATNSSGGSTAATTWETRPINTKNLDTDGICTLTSNQFTLPAGTYDIDAWSCGFRVNFFACRLYNVTAGAVVSGLIVNTNVSVDAASWAERPVTTISGRFTLASSTTLRLEQYGSDAQTTNGFGAPANLTGVSEIYAMIDLRKVA